MFVTSIVVHVCSYVQQIVANVNMGSYMYKITSFLVRVATNKHVINFTHKANRSSDCVWRCDDVCTCKYVDH